MTIVIDYDRSLPHKPSTLDEKAVFTCSDGTIKYTEAYEGSMGLRWKPPVVITKKEYDKLLGYI
jgi:hypothetical protein